MSTIRLFLNKGMAAFTLAIGVVFLVSSACMVSFDAPEDVFEEPRQGPSTAQPQVIPATQSAIPTLTLPAPGEEPAPTLAAPEQPLPGTGQSSLVDIYNQYNPGVVNITVYLTQSGLAGAGAGSGFILSADGYIVTNDHVVSGADSVTIIFFDGHEAEAQIVGTDEDSDLAVLKVDALPEGTHPLTLGDSDQVQVGEWVVAIGNPFGRLGNSMSVGIVSAIGRDIPAGATNYRIPQAIQTDAAINPGNSGGPLLNMRGEVIGVNAQIVTGGAEVNSGVGFAIPSNIVRKIAPVLIEQGAYQWPYLGVTGGSVSLAIAQANNLEQQAGAYIDGVIEGGPAAKAGLRGSTGTEIVNGLETPVGGDVIVDVDGEPIFQYNDLLVEIASRNPGDVMTLGVIRNGQRQEVQVTLEPRP